MKNETMEIPALLRRHGLRPRKSLGQNFLVDESALQRVVAAAGLEADAVVLEIGPGLGSLTRLLAESARRVVCVELDPALIPVLHEVLAPFQNVQIVQGDILRLDPSTYMKTASESALSPYLVVANIPYYITSALMRHLLEGASRPQRMVLTVQREVAERICAGPGDMSLLALSVQLYGAPRLAGRIPANAFYPVPKVDSAIIRVDLLPERRLPAEQVETFFRLAKAGFSQKRKTLRNALAAGMHWSALQSEAFLNQSGIDPMRRAETLSLEEWGALVEVFRLAAHTSSPKDHQ